MHAHRTHTRMYAHAPRKGKWAANKLGLVLRLVEDREQGRRKRVD